MILERGALLKNRYRIVEILGQGGMGSVYRAVDENLGVEVAVKDNLFTTEEYARQFRREAVILANLRHPNLPRVTDHFVIEGQGQYLIMDFIEGEDLRQRMDRTGLLSEDDVITIGAAICDALTYLNTRNPPIVHRDIKPGNVKISPQGGIFLVDFGLAKVLQGTQATTTGARAMTPGYSPPEQYGTARTDQRSDIFSLGATLYAALTGAIPEDALARAMDQTELTSIRKHNSRVSRRMASVIEKSLSVRPDDRYQTADEFKQALLNARSASRRRTENYSIAPSPDVVSRPIAPDGILPPPPPENPLSEPVESTPLPLRISTPIEEPVLNRNPGRSGQGKGVGGCWIVAIFLGLLMVGGGGAAYTFNPALLAQAFAWMRNAPLIMTTQTPTRALAAIPGDTETPTPNTPYPYPAPVTSLVAVGAASPTATPFPTLEPTSTSLPTQTLAPKPTQMGGGNGQIAFASDSSGVVQIYLQDIDGGIPQRITDMPEGACQPNFSPDGQRLVFISPCDSEHESYPGAALFLINVDGSGLMPLPSAPGGDYDPAWSPDGKKIAFTSIRNGGRPRIYLFNLEDNSVKRLSDQYVRDLQPSWSADGRHIVFASTRRGPTQIWFMDANGQNQMLFSASVDRIDQYPNLSPDGKVVLFTQQVVKGGVPKLFVAPVEEGEDYTEFRVSQDQSPMREARYSPDGLWIVFEGWPQGSNHDIYIMTANGVGRKALTTGPSIEFDPTWRPFSP